MYSPLDVLTVIGILVCNPLSMATLLFLLTSRPWGTDSNPQPVEECVPDADNDVS